MAWETIVGAGLIIYALYLGTRALDDRLEKVCDRLQKVCDLLERVEGKLDSIHTTLEINRD